MPNTAFRAARIAAHMSQDDLVRALESRGFRTSKRNVQRYESGETTRPNYAARRALEQALGVTYDELGFAPDVIDEMVIDRRELLTLAAGAAVAASDPMDRLRHALATDRAPDREAVDGLEHTTALLYEREEYETAAALAVDLDRHVDTLSWSLNAARGESMQRRLTVTAGEAAALAGWVAYDLGHHDRARGYWQLALDAARTAGDGPVIALVLSYLSYLSAERREHQQAWVWLDEASQHVKAPEHARARAWIAGRQAEEAAALGDASALISLERAMTAMDYAGDGRPWARFFDNSRLGSMAVATYGRLRHPELVPAADAVLGSIRDAKTRAVILGDVATAYIGTGDIDRGCAVATQALDVTLATEATLGRQRLTALRPTVAALDAAPARELTQRLAVLD